jgi:hypothetical protein
MKPSEEFQQWIDGKIDEEGDVDGDPFEVAMEWMDRRCVLKDEKAAKSPKP